MPSTSLNTDIATRALIVTAKAGLFGNPMSTKDIICLTGIPKSTINAIYARAIERGFDPVERPIKLLNKHLEDAPRSGRPTKNTENTRELLISQVRLDRYGREKTCAELAGDLSQLGIEISAHSIARILKKMGFKKTKPTRKPGLTKKMRQERLTWALLHQDWTLDQWKLVIFSDETSVVLGHRRGGYRIWRTKDERFLKSCIRERWKGYSEFMFWGSFSYNYKGPCHIWREETVQEKKEAEIQIKQLNEELEPIYKAEWELNNSLRRLGLRNRPGPKPVWRWITATGKLSRTASKGGIDWWRYQNHIIKPKLIPFAQRYGLTVQEDKAPSHIHHHQAIIYSAAQVARLTWPGNSPDLNAIEPCWPYLKRITTKKGAPSSHKQAQEAWLKAWKELPQEKIRAWIEAIPVHIKRIIDCEGGNEYKEGRDHVRQYNRVGGARGYVGGNDWVDIE